MKSVMILGAGFSRAIADRMPTTDELGKQVTKSLTKVDSLAIPEDFRDGRFEAWLSRSAEPQPDLTEEENLRNRARFLEISSSIHRMLSEHQNQVLDGTPPWWLFKLVGIAHKANITLVTFNYDTLVECAAGSSVLWDWQVRTFARGDRLVRELPPTPSTRGLISSDERASTFRLLKLHGSVDSYWVAGDVSGATIQRRPGHPTWGSAAASSNETLETEMPDRVPFIVPPAAAKSSYYQNPVTRQIWRSARRALLEASQIALVGYSLPVTDLVTQGLLSDVVSHNAACWVVVNPDAARVATRLASIGVDVKHVVTHNGEAAVEEFVNSLETSMAIGVRDELESLSLADDTPLTVAMSQHQATPVLGIDQRGAGDLVLRPEEWCLGGSATRRREPNEPTVATLSDLRAAYARSDTANVTLSVEIGSKMCHVIGVESWAEATGHAGRWIGLVPTAMPRLKFFPE